MCVSQCFSDIISKCLQKKSEKRPLIDDIIANDIFQQKAKQLKIKLPQVEKSQTVSIPNLANELRFDQQKGPIGIKGLKKPTLQQANSSEDQSQSEIV